MPMVAIKVIEGVFSEEERNLMLKKVTEAMISIEGEALRQFTHVTIEEVKTGNWAIGGKALSANDVKALRSQK